MRIRTEIARARWAGVLLVTVLLAPGAMHRATAAGENRATLRAEAVLAPAYIVTDMGTFDGELANAFGVNDLGEVVGRAEHPDTAIEAFLWREGELIGLGSLVESGLGSTAFAINNNSEVVGDSPAPDPDFPGNTWVPVYWSEDTGMINIGDDFTHTGTGRSFDINDQGVAVGIWRGRAFTWSLADGYEELELLPDAFFDQSEAKAINENGMVVGSSSDPEGFSKPVRWQPDGTIEQLPTLGGNWGTALEVNIHGEIAGETQLSSGHTRPVYWNPDGSVVEIPLLDQDPPLDTGHAEGINDNGVIVGWDGSSAPGDGRQVGWVYPIGGTKVRLNDLIDPDSGWDIRIPLDINNHGQIVGIGIRTIDGVPFPGRAFLLTPVAGPDLTFDPPDLAFGDVEVGTTSPPQTAMLTNNGDSDATGLIFSGLPDSGFEADTSACGDTLPAGESCAVSVTFTPSATGPANATLLVDGDDGVATSLDLSGNGVGVGGPVADISPGSFAFEVPPGGDGSDTLNIGNLGDADLTWNLSEAESSLATSGKPYAHDVAWTPEFHAPVGYDRAAGLASGRGEAPADRVVLPAPQPAAISELSEGFDDISMLPGAGWAMINNSEPLGPTSWFQGNDSIFPSHEGAPDAYIAANFDSTGDNGDISNWLLTPEVTIVSGTELCFWTRTSEQFEEFYDRLEVRMSVEGNSTDVGETAESVGDFITLLHTVNPDLEPNEYPEEWTEICVEVRERSREPVTGRFAFRYWVTDAGANGSNGDYIGIDTVSVTQPGGGTGCASPTDVPWLAANPTSGSTAPGDSEPVTVTVDATDLEIGEHSARLCVTTNDPSAPLVEVPVSLTVTSDGGTTFVETFDDGSNTGGWTFGIPQIEVAESDGGNPGWWRHSTCEGLECLDTTAPQLRTEPIGDVNEFTGDYRQRGVTSVGVDLQTIDVDFNAEGRPLTVMLMQDNGTPGDVSDDWAAYFIGDENVPLVGEGWKSFSFDIPSDAQELPADWQFLQFGGNAPEPDWNMVIENVSQLRYFYGDPELIFIFQQWELGLDNARITYTTPNPGGNGPGVDLETSKEKRDVEGKHPVPSRPQGRGVSFTAPSSGRR